MFAGFAGSTPMADAAGRLRRRKGFGFVLRFFHRRQEKAGLGKFGWIDGWVRFAILWCGKWVRLSLMVISEGWRGIFGFVWKYGA